jgi:large subunit ribosomal protein L24
LAVRPTGILPAGCVRARCPHAPQAGSLCHNFMNRIKCHVKKGDQVEVISGNFRGSSGRILAVFPGKQRVLVEGVRIIKKHLRKSQDNPSGKIAEREGPIHISNVKLIEREKKTEKRTAKKSKKEKEEQKAA